MSLGCKQRGPYLGQVFVGGMKGLRVVRVDSVWQPLSSHKSLECQQELVSGHIGAKFQVDSTCDHACKESNIAPPGGAPHLDIQEPCEVNSSYLKGVLGFYSVSGKWSFNFLTAGFICHLEWKTFVQHLPYGLACKQYPKFFSQFG